MPRFRFFGLRFFSRHEPGRDKKDAEPSKIVTSPYLRTAETVFGGRKSENIKPYAGIRQDSDTSSVKLIILKINYTGPVFAFSVCAFLADPQRGEIKSFGVFDFVAQGVQLYVVRRNRTQKKRKHQTLCRNPSGFRHIIGNMGHTNA